MVRQVKEDMSKGGQETNKEAETKLLPLKRLLMVVFVH